VAQPRLTAAADAGACGRSNAVGLISILDRGQFSLSHFAHLAALGLLKAAIKSIMVYRRESSGDFATSEAFVSACR